LTGTLECWALNILPALCGAGSGICELCPNVSLTDGLSDSSPAQAGRIILNGALSSCATTQACIGFSATGTFRYKTFLFRNGLSNACINVTLNASTTNSLIAAAYRNSYDPSDQCNNHLADTGGLVNSNTPTRTFFFPVGSNALFVVVVVQPATGPATP